jgi:hypothetical protein
MKAVKLKLTPEVNLQGRYVVIRPAIFEDTLLYKEPDSVVTEVVRIPTGRSGLRIPTGSRDFPFSKMCALVQGLSSLLFNGYRCSFRG